MAEQHPAAWEATCQALKEGDRLSRERGIDLVVVFVPVMVRVMPGDLEFARIGDRDRFLPGKGVVREGDFGERLRAFCKRMGCGYVDLLPAFQQAAARENRGLYIPDDEHLDRSGHEVTARAILAQIRDAPVRPAGPPHLPPN
jgi:hypothetical protein